MREIEFDVVSMPARMKVLTVDEDQPRIQERRTWNTAENSRHMRGKFII